MNVNRQKRTIETTASDARRLDAAANLAFECHHFAAALKLANLSATAKAAYDAVLALQTALAAQQPQPASLPGQAELPGLDNEGPPATKADTSSPEAIAAWQARQDAAKDAPLSPAHQAIIDVDPNGVNAREAAKYGYGPSNLPPREPGGMNETQDLPEADRESYEQYEREKIQEAVENRASGEWEAFETNGGYAVALMIDGKGRVFLDGEGHINGGDKPLQLWHSQGVAEELAAARNVYERERAIGPHAKKGRKAKAIDRSERGAL